MAHARSAIALDPRRFGRGRQWKPELAPQAGWTISDDLKLFAATFVGGFLFVSILIG